MMKTNRGDYGTDQHGLVHVAGGFRRVWRYCATNKFRAPLGEGKVQTDKIDADITNNLPKTINKIEIEIADARMRRNRPMVESSPVFYANLPKWKHFSSD